MGDVTDKAVQVRGLDYGLSTACLVTGGGAEFSRRAHNIQYTSNKKDMVQCVGGWCKFMNKFAWKFVCTLGNVKC
jgi:hypothetical protein